MINSQRLKDLRNERRLTLQTVADCAHVSKSYVWEMENGKAPNPTIEILIRVSNVLGVGPMYLCQTESDLDSCLDEYFFLAYKKLNPTQKAQMRSIIETFR